MRTFGESPTLQKLMKKFGFIVDAIVAAALEQVNRTEHRVIGIDWIRAQRRPKKELDTGALVFTLSCVAPVSQFRKWLRFLTTRRVHWSASVCDKRRRVDSADREPSRATNKPWNAHHRASCGSGSHGGHVADRQKYSIRRTELEGGQVA